MITTRKDLYRIADALAAARPEFAVGAAEQWRKDVSAVADALEVTTGFTPNGNRSFDRDRFYAACGIEKEES